jgi:hypothetical protein
MAMKMNWSVISAMLGVALLAAPITASAHEDWRNRGPARAYNSYRHEFSPRANFGTNMAPGVAANNWGWRKGAPWRNSYRPAVAPSCPVSAPYNAYPNNNYQQGYYPQPYNAAPAYYPQAYNSAPAYYGAPMGGGLANYGAPLQGGLAGMIQQRDNAQALYQQALRNGNRVRAKHLNNDIVALNKRIGNTRKRDGYGAGYGSFDQSYANNNRNGYGYPNSNLNALSPMLRNFIP